MPHTIKGTSLTREYVNGKGIVNKECNIDQALDFLNKNIVDRDYVSYFNISYNNNNYNIERKQRCVRNRKFRKSLNDGYRPRYRLRFGSMHTNIRKFHSGLYRIRKRIGHKKTRWSYVYLKVCYNNFGKEPSCITYTKK